MLPLLKAQCWCSASSFKIVGVPNALAMLITGTQAVGISVLLDGIQSSVIRPNAVLASTSLTTDNEGVSP